MEWREMDIKNFTKGDESLVYFKREFLSKNRWDVPYINAVIEKDSVQPGWFDIELMLSSCEKILKWQFSSNPTDRFFAEDLEALNRAIEIMTEFRDKLVELREKHGSQTT